MSSKTLCFLIRIADIGAAICALLICALLMPVQATIMARTHPDVAGVIWAWVFFYWGAVLPIFAIMVYIWKVSTAIKMDQVFTMQTAKWVKTGSLILFVDVGAFFLGNAIFVLLNLAGPPMAILSLILILFGLSMALCAAVLSRYIAKAAVLQDESEGTI